MPIDFHLSASDEATRTFARHLAQTILLPARTAYLNHSSGSQFERFLATREYYASAASLGVLKSQVSPHLGGAAPSSSLVSSTILVEECYAVEPSAALTIFATGLGLSPLNLAGSREKHGEFLAPFLNPAQEGVQEGGEEEKKERHAPLASLVFSEPGGVANVLERGGRGFQTTARQDAQTGEWIVNGEKIWACNSAGWDEKGCDLACVVCRDISDNNNNEKDEEEKNPEEKVMIILITREDLDRNPPGAFSVVRHINTPGHTSVSGPHIRYTNVRVPAKNVLCPPGKGAQVAFAAFDASAVLVGAMAVGLMRAAFDAALGFAKGDDRGGAVPLLERQAVADLLSGIKIQTEAARALTWKAAHALENGPGDYNARRELALAAKVFCSEAAVKACLDAINAVGV